MMLTDEINWSVFDFIIMGVFLLLLGIGINAIINKTENKKKQDSVYSPFNCCFPAYMGRIGSGNFWIPIGRELSHKKTFCLRFYLGNPGYMHCKCEPLPL